MSFDSREQSRHAGAPVELYEFTIGTVVMRYTSAASTQIVDAEVFSPAPLGRGPIAMSHERARNSLELECPRDFAIAELFRVAPPSDVIGLVIRRLHRGEEDDVRVIFVGRVLNCTRDDGVKARLQCEPAGVSLARPGLRRTYSRNCPLVLYSQGHGQCNAVREDHSIDTTVTDVAGLVLTVADLDDMPYAGGFVEWVRPSGLVERRFIRSFAGLELTMALQIVGITPGQAVTVSPGCDHTMQTCDEVYGNRPNYGGIILIPLKNPFGGTAVF